MAKIVEYDAKDTKVNPSNTGYSAIEMAARRIGPLYEQMAMGTREVGNLTRDLDSDTGKALTAFLRFRGLEDQASNINVKVVGSGGARTLLGTGANSGQVYNVMREAHGGPALLSGAARNAISRAATETPEQRAADADQRYWDRINADQINKMNAADKGNSYGPSGDPLQEMRDIYKEANDPTLYGPDKNGNLPGSPQNQPNYAGPGASFGPGYQDPYATQEDTGTPATAGPGSQLPPSVGQESSGLTDQSSAPPGLWGDISAGLGPNPVSSDVFGGAF